MDSKKMKIGKSIYWLFQTPLMLHFGFFLQPISSIAILQVFMGTIYLKRKATRTCYLQKSDLNATLIIGLSITVGK